jgi:alkaline phosphatase D
MLIDRRRIVQGAAMLAGASLLPAAHARQQAISFAANPFTLGVASGDPDASSVVIWTRLAPQPMAPDHGMPQEPVTVRWEVADDEGFTRIVRSGSADAHPQSAHAVHVEVDGLAAGRPYFYRFHAGNATSPVGRTRTTPARDANVASVRYVFSGCQQYMKGHYAAWRHAVAENPDFILFLGDYIYERGPKEGDTSLVRLTEKEDAKDLGSYRRRYSTYRLDPDLQAAHAAAPWMAIWDDHEVVNNYRNDWAPSEQDAAKMLLRRAAAYQAWYEHMPVRKTSAPVGPSLRIYRTLHWGRIAEVQLTDTRQYSTPTDWDLWEADKRLTLDSDLRRAENRSILGFEQETWLFDSLARSQARWNILGQQYAMEQKGQRDPASNQMLYGIDGWDGYPASRQRVVEALSRVSNPIVIGSDSHAFIASDLKLKPDGAVIAPAFVGGSISSPGNNDITHFTRDHAHIHLADNQVRGYSVVTADAKEMRLTMRVLDDVTKRDSGVKDYTSFVMENGKAGATRI